MLFAGQGGKAPSSAQNEGAFPLMLLHAGAFAFKEEENYLILIKRHSALHGKLSFFPAKNNRIGAFSQCLFRRHHD